MSPWLPCHGAGPALSFVWPSGYTPPHARRTNMAEMRLIVAGAGGRMGRTLVKAIADTKDFALAGALEDARSPLIGWDAGTLAGTPENGVKLAGDAASLIGKADAIVDFTAPVAPVV